MTAITTQRRTVPPDERPVPVEDQASFVRAMYPQLIGVFTYRGFSRAEAEDLTQETLARTCQHWGTVAAARSPEAWVHRTARNLSNSWLRRIGVARRHASALADHPTEQSDPSVGPTLEAALATLTPRQREAVVLRYFADLSVDDTATAMGCAAGTVRALTSQGLAALRQHIDIDEAETDR